MSKLIDLAKDPYERKARLTPGLLVILPVLVPMLCVYGPRNVLITSVVALLASCGAMFALASIARVEGRKLETKLVKQWGGMPTTLALRHRDPFLDKVTKGRYHRLITEKLGIEVPSQADEEQNPDLADDTYIGATKLLRERTRSNNQLLLKENIAYGFHRNMVAMKSAGLITSIAGIIFGLVLGKILLPSRPYLILQNLLSPGLASGITLLTSFAMLLAWLMYFNRDAVKSIGFVYAERLFECLEFLPTPRKKSTNK